MPDTIDYDTLFKEYVRICNAALEANKHCYPYDRVLIEIQDRLKAHTVRAAIYDADETKPEAVFEMFLDDKLIGAKTPHNPHARHPWLISRKYLEAVAAHPDTYITNPASLDWRWLNDRTIG